MASDVEIVNVALVLLGESRIISLDDNLKPAREAKAIYAITRDALLASYDWSFAKTRAQLPAVVTAPLFQYGYAYQLPVDCLRVVFVGDHYVGADLTDYRGTPTDEYAIEGRQILTDMGAPLNVRYIKRVTDPTQFASPFVRALGCQLAVDLCETLTQSETKRTRADNEFKNAIRLAVRANAIEKPPSKLADDEWVLSRL